MGLYKHPGSPYWYYSFTVRGQRITRSSKTTNKSEARQLYEAERVDYLRRGNRLPKKQTSFAVLREEFLKWSQANKRSYRRDVTSVAHLTRFFGNRLLDDITPLDIEHYKRERVQQVSGSTVNREVACLKRMYNLAVHWRLTLDNPVNGVPFFQEPKRSFRWWTREEVRRFLDACDDRMGAIALVGLNTGMRIGELLSLTWDQIDFDNGYITIERTKSGTYREVKMNHVVIAALKKVQNRSEYVLVNPATKRPYIRIGKAFRTTCRRAGIAEATPHVMRHTFASHLAMQGVDPHTIMELGGWSSLDMVMRYCHLAPDHKQRAVDKLADVLK